MSADLLALFGTDEPVEPTLALRAGPLSVRVRGTRIVSVHANGREVWHGVAFLYRDADWHTPEPVVESFEHQARQEGFRVQVRARIPVEPAIELRILIEGDASGRIRYQGTALARGDLATNRTGLCLMHPQTLAGRPIEVLHDDGRCSRSTFPALIAPWPPFMGVRGLRHAFGDGGWAECRFEGDVFELEDQRNNADASYKTYNRSNLMPRPYRLREGEAVCQSVELCLLQASRPAPLPSQAVRLSGHEREIPGTMAQAAALRVGLAIAPADAGAGDDERALLAQLRPAHLHLLLDSPAEPVDWAGIARLQQAAGGAPLRLDVQQVPEQDPAAALAPLGAALSLAGLSPHAVAVFPSTPPAVRAARHAFPGSEIGGGTAFFFTQLNRIEDLGAVDFLSFTTSSLVHGADDEAVMAGLRSLPAMARTLAARHPGLPVRVGPSGIPARASPLGGQPVSDGTRRIALARRDPRSRALFGAAWLVGYLASLAGTGVRAATLRALTGDEGLLTREGPCPATCVLALLGAQGVHAVESSDPDRLVALRSGRALLVANLTADTVLLELPPGIARVQCLDAASWRAWRSHEAASPWRGAAAQASIPMAPFGVAQLERPA